MAENIFTAKQHQDPLFATLRNQVGECSGHYPVLMLPVRIETRFAKREVFRGLDIPPIFIINNVIRELNNGFLQWQMIYEVFIRDIPEDHFQTGKFESDLEKPIGCFQEVIESLRNLPEISTGQRRFIVSVVKEQLVPLQSLDLSGNLTLRSKFNQVKKQLNDISGIASAIPLPSKSVFQPGFDAFKELERLEVGLTSIYGTKAIKANQIDSTLNAAESAIQRFGAIVESPGFMVREKTIDDIASKISSIKSLQNQSSVKLADFGSAYSGPFNLANREFQLTNQINDLKSRIDNEYIPYMRLLAKIKMFPAMQLAWMVQRCCVMLKAANTVGYPTADHLLTQRPNLYRQLRVIREHAHMPLHGSLNEIKQLQDEYAKLENELNQLIEKSHEVTPHTRTHRVGLSRMRTHLTREYLQDLKGLLPGENREGSQVISSLQMRQTAIAFQTTLDSIRKSKGNIKKIEMRPKAAMQKLIAELKKLDKKISTTASRTVLLPKDVYRQSLSAFEGLKDEITNFYTRNRIPEKHNLKPDVKGYLEAINANLSNQKLDVFDKRDPFYDEDRKTIKLLVFNEIVNELCVRFYPDDIAIDNHDERLTEKEVQAGKDYYNEVYSWPPAQREAAKLPAWRATASTIGPRRAAYVINKLLPIEVQLDTVAVPSNSLPRRINEILTPLGYNYNSSSRKRIIENFSRIGGVANCLSRLTIKEKSKYSLFLRHLPTSLEDALSPNNFTPCKNTRKDLELMKGIVKGLMVAFKPKNATNNSNDEDSEMVSQALDSTYSIIQSFYQDHLTEINIPFNPNLTFPVPKMRTKAWDRAGITSVMPDRFVVATKRGNDWIHVVVGNPVSEELNVGIDPNSNEAEGYYHNSDGELVIPEKLRWMFDFEEAVKDGMAVRIPIKEEDLKEGFSLVMVFGMRTHNGHPKNNRPVEGQKLLNQLLENHLYSDGGLEYLPVGTATNNTDTVKSPYTTLDDDYDGLFELFVNKNPQHGDLEYSNENELSITDGQYFRDALGIPSDIAELIRNHQKQDIAESKAMSRLLHDATLDNYMKLLLDHLLSKNEMSGVISFMMQNVSSVGNLPSFRIDKQPYGILPISLHGKMYLTEPPQKGTYQSFLHKLSLFLEATRKILEDQMLGKVNTINSEEYKNDPQQVFMEMLGLNSHSKQFLYRYGYHRPYDFIYNPEIERGIASYLSTQYHDLLEGLGHTTAETKIEAIRNTHGYHTYYFGGQNIFGNLVQHPDYGRGKLVDFLDYPAEWDASQRETHAIQNYWHFPRNYIGYLLQLSRIIDNNNGLFAIGKESTIDSKINTLLFELVRISLSKNKFEDRLPREAAALMVANLEVPVLERLLSGHLDICSHRIDAWLSGLAYNQLRELRKENQSGIFIGAYGFVENLSPAGEKEPAADLPCGLEPKTGRKVDISPSNQGFIHGPTLNHAVTAAVLRAGFNLQETREDDSNNVFAINLNSSRVRKALHLLEGVANGQQLGAILGYQFERALHEGYKKDNGEHLEMDDVIYRLRKAFPTYSDNLIDKTAAGVQDEALKAMNVVDGLELIDHMEEYRLDKNKSFSDSLIQQTGALVSFPVYPFGLENILPSLSLNEGAPTVAINRQKIVAIIKEIDNMADALDAMSDLITAEGVYQLVRGNHTRASAILSAMGEGRIPTDPEIIRNLREGNMVMQRVMLAMEPGGDSIPWTIDESPRSLAEPALNKWLASQLDDPRDIEWKAVFGDNVYYFKLNDLGLQPIDIISIINNEEDGLAELELRAARAAHLHGANPQETITIDFYKSSGPGKSSLGEQLAIIQQLGKAVANARVADARDFRLPEDQENFGQAAPAIDTNELFERLTNVVNRYRVLSNGLSQFTPGATLTGAQFSSAINYCIELANCGFKGYFPDVTQELESSSLIAKLLSAKGVIEKQLKRAEELLSELDWELDQAKWLSTAQEIGELLFGAGFKILPRLSISDADDLKGRMESAYNGGILRNISPEGLESWLNDVSMVRKNLAPVDTLRMLTEVCRGQKIEFSVAQLPHIPNNDGSTDEYWLGAPFPTDWKPECDKLSLVVFGHSNLGPEICGLVFDEWTEIIPIETQTSGIAFHYNQPDARPPQALLLAVPPKLTDDWSLDVLGHIVEEAYKLAKIRAIEPDHFYNSLLAQFLPATTLMAAEIKIGETTHTFSDQDVKGQYVDYGSINDVEQE